VVRLHVDAASMTASMLCIVAGASRTLALQSRAAMMIAMPQFSPWMRNLAGMT
jgi:hypothetical protein